MAQFENKYIPLGKVVEVFQDNKDIFGDKYNSIMDTLLIESVYPQVQTLSGEETISLYEEMYQSLSEARDEFQKLYDEVEKMGEPENKKPEENIPRENPEDVKKTAEEVAQRTTKELLEAEKTRIEEAQKMKEEEIKRAEIQEMKQRELQQKEKELEEISNRLKLLEEERANQRKEQHQGKVQSVVDNMIKAGVITQEEAEAKVNTLSQLGEDALEELNGVITRKLTNEPAKSKINPADVNRKEYDEQARGTDKPLDPITSAFQKIQELKRINPNDPFFRGV